MTFSRESRGLPKFSILTPLNPKVLKGIAGTRYFGCALMLSPHRRSGFNVCSHASPGCIRGCLNTAGKGGMGPKVEHPSQVNNAMQMRRIERTRLLFTAPAAFWNEVIRDIRMMLRFTEEYTFDHFNADRRPVFRPRGHMRRMHVAVRLNGTSDIPFEKVRIAGAANIMTLFPQVRFYDYTKVPGRRPLRNYHLTYSWSERPECERVSKEYYRAGVNTAVVFDAVPPTWGGRKVIDGLVNDYRFLDPAGVIVGLKAKGFAIGDETGFVVRMQPNLPFPPAADKQWSGEDLFPDVG